MPPLPFIKALTAYRSDHPEEADTAQRFIDLLNTRPDCFERTCLPGHITASAWLLDTQGERVLMTHHRKLDRWLLLGGHSDGNPHPLQVALQEALEESGLLVTPVDDRPVDLDIHTIPARPGEPEHLHFDVRYVLQAAGSNEFVVSPESIDLAWVPIEDLGGYTQEASIMRIQRKLGAGL